MIAATPTPAVRYEFAVLQWLQDDAVLRGTAWALLLAFGAWAVWWYWRERSTLGGWTAGGLTLLRLTALVAVASMVLGPQRRTAEVQQRPSKVVLLVDTTLSMSLPTNEPPTNEPSDAPQKQSRFAALVRGLRDTPLLAKLAENHDVEIHATDGGWRQSFVPPGDDERASNPSPAIDFANLQPNGASTKLGDVISRVVEENAGRPLAGVVLLSDGQQNAGSDPLGAAASVQQRSARLHTIGFGPTKPGVNLAVRELFAPTRAYPKDDIEITALVETSGVMRPVEASLYRRREADAANQAELVATQRVDWTTDNPDQVDRPPNDPDSKFLQQSVVFTTQPPAVGRYLYTVRLPTGKNELDQEDNERQTSVEVIDRVLKVLLLAGGPSRDYRFLRDQLRRDDAFEVDVLLQSASPGGGQDADRVLTDLPATDEELHTYDMIVAYDPDWQRLGKDAERRIERAVSEYGAGLLYAPGPVHTPRWLGSQDPSRIKALLPVGMPDRWLALSTSGEASRVRSPIKLTTAGTEAEFLWIAGSRAESLTAWQQFPGFYRCFPVQSIKPGATVYARTQGATSSDAAVAGTTGVLLAEQFFGAGRVMILSSSELWRLRRIEPAYFSTLTTKLLQHLSQGRLLANSPDGSLMFERARYRVGDTVLLRATRIAAAAGDSPSAQVIEPDGTVRSVPLRGSESQTGAWTARWRATQPGVVRAALANAKAELSARTEVRVPAQERSSLVRDERLLKQLAATGGGQYYANVLAANDGGDNLPTLDQATPSQAETTVAFGQPDPEFAEQCSRWALGLIAGCLIAEWLLRRINRLA